MSDQWKERKRPPRLERQYKFDSYDDLRDFLDSAAELSEKEDYFPDMGFGRDYVNITIYVDEGEEELSPKHHQFAKQLDELNGNKAH